MLGFIGWKSAVKPALVAHVLRILPGSQPSPRYPYSWRTKARGMTLSPFVWCSGNIVVDWLTSGLAGVLLDNFMWSLWLFDYFLSLLSDKRPCYTPLVEDSCEPKRRVRTIHEKGVLPLGLGRKS